MGPRLHQWDDNGSCRFCGVKALDMTVNGAMFCAGSAEARSASRDPAAPVQQTPPSSGGFGMGGSSQSPPTTPQQPQATGHDWDAAGFCKLCKLGMYAVKQLNLPCRPVPGLIVAPPGYGSAFAGHEFDFATGLCSKCGYHQIAIWQILGPADCNTTQALKPNAQRAYSGLPVVAPFEPTAHSHPYLIQWTEKCDFNTWEPIMITRGE